MNGLHRVLILAGVALILAGAGIFVFQRLNIPVGRLPGDIIVKKEKFSFYFPITTSLIISVLISAILYFFRK